MTTFLWHDYETFGLSPSKDRPAQFAAIRTDENLNPIENPLCIYCKPSFDTMPSAQSIGITGITPQYCLDHGLPEADFARTIHKEMIRENISRTGLENIGAKVQDAAVFDGESEEKADIVIADLPCSGLGVLGKKTDLKYKASPEGTEALVHLQREILSCVQRYVKPGGTLVYSTCTVDPAENMDNVYWFLQKYPEFRQDDIRGRLCPELREDVQGEGCLQLLPGIHQSDGFFIAKLTRKEEN